MPPVRFPAQRNVTANQQKSQSSFRWAMPGMFGPNASRCSHYFGDGGPACARRLRRSFRPEYSSLHLRPIGSYAAIVTAAERMDHTAPIEQENSLVI
jgi:hypothetical protein